MARKKRVLYDFHELFRQDKLDDYIFAYFTGVKRGIPSAKLLEIAYNFQSDFGLNEENCAVDIIIASYQRSMSKYQKHSKLLND